MITKNKEKTDKEKATFYKKLADEYKRDLLKNSKELEWRRQLAENMCLGINERISFIMSLRNSSISACIAYYMLSASFVYLGNFIIAAAVGIWCAYHLIQVVVWHHLLTH